MENEAYEQAIGRIRREFPVDSVTSQEFSSDDLEAIPEDMENQKELNEETSETIVQHLHRECWHRHIRLCRQLTLKHKKVCSDDVN